MHDNDLKTAIPNEESFRAAVLEFLKENCEQINESESTQGDDPDRVRECRNFQKELFKAGLAALSYSKEHGGAGLTSKHQELFDEIARDWRLPNGPLYISHGMCLPMLDQYGTEEQKNTFMKDCISGEKIWCQLFSEPGAGSDVASLSTRANRDGDEWVITGQKVWTSGAHYADLGLVVARTDPSLPKHKGLSMFIVDFNDPTVEVKPLKQISGGSGFNEVFFNETRVSSDRLLGDLNQGWNLAVSMLMFERVSIGAGGGSLTADRTPTLIELAKTLNKNSDPCIRQILADLWMREKIRRFIGQRVRDSVAAGRVPGPEGSIAKLNGSLLARLFRDASMKIVGTSGQAWEVGDEDAEKWSVGCLAASGVSIAGGTDEVQRNIIGERVLGLPKEPDLYKGASWDSVPRN
ncbi:MAG: dehydrogenase [Acidimicrobiaceae bacterium]|jgi:alkylation response protein AidB-like acyl-CoA dehydrogenase|nr:dehydrogenase [Acidimicrobiaceae bacterium]|tara:strand:- start:3689 stop:4912 length:1224 start_codon:yes stop_codon:yes gene_type:complete